MSELAVQLVKFDPLPELGQFVLSGHRGIDVRSDAGKDSTLSKTSGGPDSNNVFLRHSIREPCFAEFEVTRSTDEISFGVTCDTESVEKKSGFSNLSSPS